MSLSRSGSGDRRGGDRRGCSRGGDVYYPVSPPYGPDSPAYRPMSPRYSPDSPPYGPVSPSYRPASPAYNQSSPSYNPGSSTPPYNPLPLSDYPTSPTYTPGLLTYSPTSPTCNRTTYYQPSPRPLQQQWLRTYMNLMGGELAEEPAQLPGLLEEQYADLLVLCDEIICEWLATQRQLAALEGRTPPPDDAVPRCLEARAVMRSIRGYDVTHGLIRARPAAEEIVIEVVPPPAPASPPPAPANDRATEGRSRQASSSNDVGDTRRRGRNRSSGARAVVSGSSDARAPRRHEHHHERRETREYGHRYEPEYRRSGGRARSRSPRRPRRSQPLAQAPPTTHTVYTSSTPYAPSPNHVLPGALEDRGSWPTHPTAVGAPPFASAAPYPPAAGGRFNAQHQGGSDNAAMGSHGHGDAPPPYSEVVSGDK